VSGMHVHDNGGPGLWFDVAVLDTTVEKSLIADNQSPGVRYEISYDGFIRDNIFLRNGLTDPNYTNDPWVWGASIAIRTSQNVWVEDNFIADSGAGIIVIDMPHRDGAERLSVQPNMRDPQNREYASIENHIFRNTVVYTGRAGAAVGGSDPSNPRVFHMNEFDYNEYIGVEFWWENDSPPYWGRSYTWEEWHAVGNDLNTQDLLTQRPATPPWSNPW
ncbi:MAG: right-handed parallel beta-helix repeat-containing protein, partial [Acidimicrobiia bacterium]|nr:right-handed parallel beta-helix repeat-containing protein [Acidimicrobiia bacterium]NNL27277.1 hypothetical protein [Acidimicrobiia bacterium]